MKHNYIGSGEDGRKVIGSTEGVKLSGISFLSYMTEKRDGTVVGWHAGESQRMSAEGESRKLRISQAKGQRFLD